MLGGACLQPEIMEELHSEIAACWPFEGGSIGQDMAKMDKLLKGAANPSQAILSCTQ